MKKTKKELGIVDLLNSSAKNIKSRHGQDVVFRGDWIINSKIRVCIKTKKGLLIIGFLWIRRNCFAWQSIKCNKRWNYNYADVTPTEIVDIVTKKIEAALIRFQIIGGKEQVGTKIVAPIVQAEGIRLHLSDDVLARIGKHVHTRPDLECGGYLIGRLQWSEDGQYVTGYVEDIFHDDSVGSAAQYTFTAPYGLKAYSYCLKNYSNEDGVFSKNIIGNYHSHGGFNAFFSPTDRTMIFSGTAAEFYLVFSPGRKEVTALFKNKAQKLFAIHLKQKSGSEFRYCEPTIPHVDIDYTKRGEA
ncbi:MAG: Mov34/MPN/PAD-1 family protein [Firmicutes bacterium]|nr:Mov34/MPN/PAD-1 family protein [Bacillota bacterium]